MIVIGYQGIGKSTLAHQDKNFIDLESGCFWVNDERPDNWYEYYCNVAEHLSAQGYIVFVSSHEVVRERLWHSGQEVVCCVPSLDLKTQWIQKLEDRYNMTKLNKDYKAWMNAADRYEENIREIAGRGFKVLWIKGMRYDLRSLIMTHVKSFGGVTFNVFREEVNKEIDKSVSDLTDVKKYRSEARRFKNKYVNLKHKVNQFIASLDEDVTKPDEDEEENDTSGS